MSLQQDYRPSTFNSFVGNDNEVESLKLVLKRESPPSAFLITGPSGTGKTTIARIIKNELEVDQTDYTELNASDDRGVNPIRNLIKSMQFAPLGGSRKLYFLDEAHQLTKEAQEALLKSLEEPPNYVHWCICTTNPESLKTTLKRRCHHYELSPLSNSEINSLLIKIARKEKRRPNKTVFSEIIERSEGSAGIALKLLDQVIDMMKNTERAISVLKSSGASESEVKELCQILVKRGMTPGTKWSKVKTILKNLKAEPESARRMILGYLNAVLLNSGNEEVYFMMEEFSKNYYDSGKAGLTLSCYSSIFGGSSDE